jgi:hypothetical protein
VAEEVGLGSQWALQSDLLLAWPDHILTQPLKGSLEHGPKLAVEPSSVLPVGLAFWLQVVLVNLLGDLELGHELVFEPASGLAFWLVLAHLLAYVPAVGPAS